MNTKHILLDMDGVLCDFRKAACKAHQQMELYHAWPAGEYDMEKVLGLTHEQFWKPIDADANFWLNIEPMPWFDDLIKMVNDFGPYLIVSSPSNRANAAAGKIEWLHKYFGDTFKDYFLGHHKFLLNGLLIDDCEMNCDMASASILFPSVSNRLWYIPYPLIYIKRQLQCLY